MNPVKKPYYILITVIFLVAGIVGYQFITTPNEEIEDSSDQMLATSEIKDCGSYFSQKGGNSDDMNRECFLEAYSTCTSAKVTHQVKDPDDHTITTTAQVDTMEDDRCRIRVQVDNKFTFPENDIYYCYNVSRTEFNDYSIQIDECEDRKPLVL